MKLQKKHFINTFLVLNLLCLVSIYPFHSDSTWVIRFFLIPLSFLIALTLVIVDKIRTPLQIVSLIILFLPDIFCWGFSGLALFGDTVKNLHPRLMDTISVQQPVYPDSGFTNKAEAKNLRINGLKEGKWIKYDDTTRIGSHSDTNAQFYSLTVYKTGFMYGVIRSYFKSGNLRFIGTCVDGRPKGVLTWYYENGKVWKQDTE